MNEPSPLGKTTPRPRRRSFRLSARSLLLILLVVALGFALPLIEARTNPAVEPPLPLIDGYRSSSASGSEGTPLSGAADAPTQAQATPSPSATTPPTEPPATWTPTTGQPAATNPTNDAQGLWIVALSEGPDTHLFAFHPLSTPITRLTTGPWDDITPAVSPNGSRVAFASNRDGQWDLYLLDLTDGEVTRLTDTPEYEAAPSWSPDGLWLAYEMYQDDNLEIYVRPVANDQPPIPLTAHPAADFAPTWSPRGRQIAFVSTRSGDAEVWLADLDRPGAEGLRNLSQDPQGAEDHPAWSPSGEALVWASHREGTDSLMRWEVDQPDKAAQYLGSGDWPVWSPDGQAILARLRDPVQTYVATYITHSQGLMGMPALAMPGEVEGMTWLPTPPPANSVAQLSREAAITPTPLWLLALTPDPDIPSGRRGIIPLQDVQAPDPRLHDMVDEAFQALRLRVAEETGWDALASLENAFVPLTNPLPPGMGNDWLYTGRAFALTSVPLDAGWMVVVREDFGPQTFWRVYLRARFQDGSQGMPLHQFAWDFSARYQGDPQAYEQGGLQSESIPSGYWVDFTRLAAAYGWERFPALGNWRSFYPGARFNEFALTGGLEWRTAMLELYPPEALITPTPVIPPTRTPTLTPRWYRTPTPTTTPTPRPTRTPSPTAQATPTQP